MSEKKERQRVAEEALTWLGTPYHHQGRIKGVGVDCAMILCEVFHAAGVLPYIDPLPYAHDWHLHRDVERYLGKLQDYARQVKIPRIGDVGIWKFGRVFSHGGIMISDKKVVHSYLNMGVILTTVDEEPLLGREVKFFSMWGK